jgi:hypothetical protein
MPLYDLIGLFSFLVIGNFFEVEKYNKKKRGD